MLNRPITPLCRIEPQCSNRQSDQSEQEERYQSSERNHRSGQPNHPHRENDPYLEDEDEEDEEYPRNYRYNPQGGRSYSNWCPTNNRDGHAESHLYDRNRQLWNQGIHDDNSEDECCQDDHRD